MRLLEQTLLVVLTLGVRGSVYQGSKALISYSVLELAEVKLASRAQEMPFFEQSRL